MQIQGVSPLLSSVTHGKLSSAGAIGAIGELKPLTSISISPTSYAKFDFLQRLRAAADGGLADGTFLERLAEQYGTIRQELEAEGFEADPRKESLAMLDEVYGAVATETADRVAGTFDAFFGYAAYGFSGDDRFDRDAFKAHLIAMAQDAKTAAASGAGSVEAMLASKYAPSDRLETIGYRDLVGMTGAIRDILRAAPPIMGGDASEYGAAVADWQKAANGRLASAELSDAAKSQATAALEKQAQTRLKAGAFTRAVDAFQAKVDEALRELASLNAQRAWIEELLRERAKEYPPGHPMLQQLLKREQQLSEESKEVSTRMKEWKEKGKDLSDAPHKVTETDQYKDVMKGYTAQLGTADTSSEA